MYLSSTLVFPNINSVGITSSSVQEIKENVSTQLESNQEEALFTSLLCFGTSSFDEYLFKLYEAGAIDKYGNLTKEAKLTPLNTIQKEKLKSILSIPFIVYTDSDLTKTSEAKKEPTCFSIYLEDFLLFLYEECKLSNVTIKNIEIIGSVIPWILSEGYVNTLFPEISSTNFPKKKPTDYDIRINLASDTGNYAFTHILEKIKEYFIKRTGISRNEIKKKIFLDMHLTDDRENKLSVGTQKNENYYSIISFGNRDNLNVDIMPVVSLKRRFLFDSQNLVLDILPYLLSRKPCNILSIENRTLNNSQELILIPTSYGHEEEKNAQSLIDLLGKKLTAIDPHSIDHNGWMRLLILITKGYRIYQEELEEILFCNARVKATGVKLGEISRQSDLVTEIANILAFAVKKKLKNNPQAQLAMIVNALTLLESRLTPESMRQLDGKIKKILQHINPKTELAQLVHSLLQKNIISFEIIHACLQVAGFIMLQDRKSSVKVTTHYNNYADANSTIRNKALQLFLDEEIYILIPFDLNKACHILANKSLTELKPLFALAYKTETYDNNLNPFFSNTQSVLAENYALVLLESKEKELAELGFYLFLSLEKTTRNQENIYKLLQNIPKVVDRTNFAILSQVEELVKSQVSLEPLLKVYQEKSKPSIEEIQKAYALCLFASTDNKLQKIAFDSWDHNIFHLNKKQLETIALSFLCISSTIANNYLELIYKRAIEICNLSYTDDCHIFFNLVTKNNFCSFFIQKQMERLVNIKTNEKNTLFNNLDKYFTYLKRNLGFDVMKSAFINMLKDENAGFVHSKMISSIILALYIQNLSLEEAIDLLLTVLTIVHLNDDEKITHIIIDILKKENVGLTKRVTLFKALHATNSASKQLKSYLIKTLNELNRENNFDETYFLLTSPISSLLDNKEKSSFCQLPLSHFIKNSNANMTHNFFMLICKLTNKNTNDLSLKKSALKALSFSIEIQNNQLLELIIINSVKFDIIEELIRKITENLALFYNQSNFVEHILKLIFDNYDPATTKYNLVLEEFWDIFFNLQDKHGIHPAFIRLSEEKDVYFSLMFSQMENKKKILRYHFYFMKSQTTSPFEQVKANLNKIKFEYSPDYETACWNALCWLFTDENYKLLSSVNLNECFILLKYFSQETPESSLNLSFLYLSLNDELLFPYLLESIDYILFENTKLFLEHFNHENQLYLIMIYLLMAEKFLKEPLTLKSYNIYKEIKNTLGNITTICKESHLKTNIGLHVKLKNITENLKEYLNVNINKLAIQWLTYCNIRVSLKIPLTTIQLHNAKIVSSVLEIRSYTVFEILQFYPVFCGHELIKLAGHRVLFFALSMLFIVDLSLNLFKKFLWDTHQLIFIKNELGDSVKNDYKEYQPDDERYIRSLIGKSSIDVENKFKELFYDKTIDINKKACKGITNEEIHFTISFYCTFFSYLSSTYGDDSQKKNSEVQQKLLNCTNIIKEHVDDIIENNKISFSDRLTLLITIYNKFFIRNTSKTAQNWLNSLNIDVFEKDIILLISYYHVDNNLKQYWNNILDAWAKRKRDEIDDNYIKDVLCDYLFRFFEAMENSNEKHIQAKEITKSLATIIYANQTLANMKFKEAEETLINLSMRYLKTALFFKTTKRAYEHFNSFIYRVSTETRQKIYLEIKQETLKSSDSAFLESTASFLESIAQQKEKNGCIT